MDYVEVLTKCANGDTDICKHCDFERITMDTYGEYCGDVLMKRAAEYIEALETTLKMREQECEYCHNQYDKKHKMLSVGDALSPIEVEIIHEEVKGEPLLSINVQDNPCICGTSLDINYCPMCGRKLV